MSRSNCKNTLKRKPIKIIDKNQTSQSKLSHTQGKGETGGQPNLLSLRPITQ